MRPAGAGRGKIGSLLAVGGTLYAVVNLQDRPWPKSSVALWASTDGGASWLRPAWRFAGKDLRPVELVNLGPGYADAPDAYVYMTAARPVDPAREVFLVRAPADALQDRTQYAYFAGTDATGLPALGRRPGSAVPVFADPAGAEGPALVWDAGLGRYLLTAGHGGGGTLGLFEAQALWGPWSTIGYEARWLGMRGGDYLGSLPERLDGGRRHHALDRVQLLRPPGLRRLPRPLQPDPRHPHPGPAPSGEGRTARSRSALTGAVCAATPR